MGGVTLTEIAKEINARMRILERRKGRELGLFWCGAVRAGNRIHVVDVSYQGHSSITKSEALEFLEWLRAGNEGGYLDFWDWKRSGGADDELA